MEEEGEKADDDDDAGGLRARLRVDGAAGRPDDVGDEHADAAPGEQRAAAQAIDEEGCGKGGGEVEDLRGTALLVGVLGAWMLPELT